MERQIKFRAKRLDNGGWAYGGLIDVDDYCIIDQGNELYVERDYVFRGDTHFFQLSGVMCDKKTIGQFTGLYDKNGTEIYEGDIIEITNPNTKEKYISTVKWNLKGYYAAIMGNNGNVILGYIDKSLICIIGNIHDNPSLISNKQ